MCFCLHDLEELYHRSHNGGNGHIVAAIPDSKTLSINYIHRYRFGAFTFEHPVLKGSAKSNEQTPVDGHLC